VHCELIVPGLLSAPHLASPEARYPALELLLARGRRESPDSLTLEQWLHQAFEQPGETLAAGALGRAASGADAGDGWWARADPVHLRVMRDRAVVAPGEALQLSIDETNQFITALNQYFSGTATFHPLDARRWSVRFSEEKSFLEKPAIEAAGRDVATARGNEALLTEIQMLLHAHPVNEAREARGEPAVNSLWVWGAGRMPAEAHGEWRSVAASEPSTLGLAQLAGIRRLALPASAAAWLEQLPGEGRHLAVLDALRAPAALEQHAEYEEAVEALERLWFQPLLAALRADRVGMVTVRAPDAAPGAGFETVRGDLRRFWRRPRAIGRYA
jgi:hypothetical protein